MNERNKKRIKVRVRVRVGRENEDTKREKKRKTKIYQTYVHAGDTKTKKERIIQKFIKYKRGISQEYSSSCKQATAQAKK